MTLEFHEGSILEEIWKYGTVLDDWGRVANELWKLALFTIEVCGDLDLHSDLCFLNRLALNIDSSDSGAGLQLDLVA